MGEFINTQCRKCEELFCFSLGVGMMYASLEEVIPFTRGRPRSALQDIVDYHQIVDAEYSHRMLACPKCDTLHERFYVRVEYDHDKIYETVFRCGKCRTLLVEPSKPVSGYRCSKCGSYSLDDGVRGLWD